MSGGLPAAALQALKHYWPQILAVALVLLFLPLLIFLCLPAILFGFGSSGGGATASMSLQATTVKGYYDQYAAYYTVRIDEIKSIVMGEGDGGNDDTVHETPDQAYTYEVVLTGEPMEEKWFIALHSVTTGNDLNAMSEQSVREFVEKSIVYTGQYRKKRTVKKRASCCRIGTTTGGRFMARKYTEVEKLSEEEFRRKANGETNREIGESYGLMKRQVEQLVNRQNRKARLIANGYVPRPKGRPRKNSADEENKRNNELVELRMQVELLRNFLSEAGRR